jgi:hypothetical protein
VDDSGWVQRYLQGIPCMHGEAAEELDEVLQALFPAEETADSFTASLVMQQHVGAAGVQLVVPVCDLLYALIYAFE